MIAVALRILVLGLSISSVSESGALVQNAECADGCRDQRIRPQRYG